MNEEYNFKFKSTEYQEMLADKLRLEIHVKKMADEILVEKLMEFPDSHSFQSSSGKVIASYLSTGTLSKENRTRLEYLYIFTMLKGGFNE